MESSKRSLIKTITWRICATFITFFVAWVVTGSIEFGIAVGAIEFWVKLIFYYLHERVWSNLSWEKYYENRK